MSNPYSPPDSNVDTQQQARSAIPRVIGIISLILAGLGLFGAIAGIAMSQFMPQIMDAQIQMGFSKGYILGSNFLSILTSLWAIFIGIKLIKYQDIGRRHFNYYTVLMIGFSVFAYFYTRSMMENAFSGMKPEMAQAAQDISSISSASIFIAPLIMIIVALLLNQKRVRESLT